MAKGVAGSVQRVMQFFLPKEEEFFPIFTNMSQEAYQGALILRKLFQEYPDVGDAVAGIEKLEHDVDTMRHDCVQRLSDTFVTPIMFDRQDILDFADTLDDVVDFTRASVDRIVLYRVESVPQAAKDLADILVSSTEVLVEACKDMRKMRDAGNGFVHRANELENQGDHVLKQGLAELFLNEKNPIEVIKWKEVYDYVEEAIDHCEDAANLIEAALVKNS